jgi:integrase
MPKNEREKTGYKGVYSITGMNPHTGKPETIFYIAYRKGGRLIEEKAGWAGKPDLMTAAKASTLRGAKIRGDVPTNAEKRAKAAADKGRMTISKLWETYETHRLRRKALGADRIRFNLHIKPALGDKIPEEVDPLSLDRFRAKLAKAVSARTKKALSPTTVRHAMALLRQIVNFGVARHLTKGFPSKVPVPSMPANQKTEDLDTAQLGALLEALDAESDQDAADIVRLALYTGARRAEIMGLQWADVDLKRGVWVLRDRKDDRDSGFPLPAAAREVLKRRETVRGTSESVFPGPGEDGHVVDPRAAFKRIQEAAGLPKGFRLLHGLRHHYASMLVSSGVDLFVVSKLLGHADPTLTARRYAHLRPGVMADAAELAGRLVAAAKRPEKEQTA